MVAWSEVALRSLWSQVKALSRPPVIRFTTGEIPRRNEAANSSGVETPYRSMNVDSCPFAARAKAFLMREVLPYRRGEYSHREFPERTLATRRSSSTRRLQKCSPVTGLP